jgi:hypothetical protein
MGVTGVGVGSDLDWRAVGAALAGDTAWRSPAPSARVAPAGLAATTEPGLGASARLCGTHAGRRWRRTARLGCNHVASVAPSCSRLAAPEGSPHVGQVHHQAGRTIALTGRKHSRAEAAGRNRPRAEGSGGGRSRRHRFSGPLCRARWTPYTPLRSEAPVLRIRLPAGAVVTGSVEGPGDDPGPLSWRGRR